MNKDETKWTYKEVKNVLCEACRLGLNTVTEMKQNESIWYHTVNGCRVECLAGQWINKTNGGDK